MSIYVCSDIHGQYELYKKMLEEISFSDSDHMYILGDVIDRGPNSIDLLLDIEKRENMTCIIGNHELMMWDHFMNNPHGEIWMLAANGALKTKSDFLRLPQEVHERLLYEFIRNWYLQIELTVNEKTFLLSHSSFIDDKGTVKWADLPDETVFETVWDSPWRMWEYRSLESYKTDGRIHVIGHVPVQHIGNIDWPDGIKPEMPCAYINDGGTVINVDLGCARMPFAEDETEGKSLCCMDLSAYANGDKDAFRFFTA